MRALILSAGYATRLYPLTLNKPKPLLKIGDLAIIDYIVEKFERLNMIQEIIVVTNKRFYSQFKEWARDKKSNIKDKTVKIISDGTTSEENKLGAIGDIDFVIRKQGLKEDLLVIAGDNLFEQGLSDFLRFAAIKSPASTIGLHRIKDMALAKHYGCVEIDRHSKLRRFEEKSSKPLSGLTAMCLYYLSRKHLKLMDEYASAGNNLDAPGYFIKYLAEKDEVYGFEFKGNWYDIGSIASHKEAVKNFKYDGRLA